MATDGFQGTNNAFQLTGNAFQQAASLVVVPDVVGQTQASGTTELEGVLFVVAVATAYSSSVAVGNIISQSPAAGASAVEGSTVTITVSLGESPNTPSGGFYGDFHVFFGKPRKKLNERIEEIEEDAEEIHDEVEREIAKIIRVEDAKADDSAELARLQQLADRYAAPGVEVPRPVLASVMKAHEERSRNALEQMRREIERMMDEEEQAVIAMLLLED